MQLWIDYRAHKQLPPLELRFGSFVVVNENLFEEFMEFKKAEKVVQGYCLIETNELLLCWIR